MSLKVIGLHGPIGAGKSTLAAMLKDCLFNRGLQPCVYSFATPMKNVMSELFGWDERHTYGDLKEVVDPKWGVSPRHAYRTFGTEWGRKLIADDIWLRMAYQQTEGCDLLIIDDVRFPNEADWVRQRGRIVHVTRILWTPAAASSHDSDKPLSPDYQRDRFVRAAGLHELAAAADRLSEYICKEKTRESVTA